MAFRGGAGLVVAALMAATRHLERDLARLRRSLVLGLAGAKEIDKADAPQLYNVVEEMAIAAGQPMPRVMILETDALNAFATGIRTGHGTIVVTRGLPDALNRDELQGVVAHEMAHLAPRHALDAVVVGVTVGLIALVCEMPCCAAMAWGSAGRSSRSGSRQEGSGERAC